MAPRDEHGEGAILELLDDQRRNQGVFEFDQCALQCLLLVLTRQTFGQPAQEGISHATVSIMARSYALLRAETGTGAHYQADHEADTDQEQDRHNLAKLNPCRNFLGYGLQQAQQSFDRLGEQLTASPIGRMIICPPNRVILV